ncbi:MAG: rhodanese-like domain-containing protein [Chloroflexi bacterium]|nr:rhodanese-like domain-containing protein [Chloroflexota bacterium]
MNHMPRPASRSSILFCILALTFLLTGCGQGQGGNSTSTPDSSSGKATVSGQIGTVVKTAYGSYTNLTPAELKPMLDNKDFFLVDVHTPPEGRLPKTDARIAYNLVEQQISKFPADKGAKLVITCRSGRMSGIASETLTRLGYTNVYNLAGGMDAWKSAGFEIIPEGK